MRRCATILLVCMLGGLDVQAGKEYPAGPDEQVVANEFVVHLMPGAAAATLIGKYLAGAQVYALRHDGFFRIRVPGGLPNGISARIAADSQVDFVEPNRVRHAVVVAPNDPNYGSSWWFPVVHALQAWSMLPGQYLTAATAGTGRVKVAVLDTGADCTHPDFINSGGTSTDSAQGGQLMFSASQAIIPTTIVNPGCAWQDDHGHGTHVTGILAAATSNGIGVSGLGYPVQVMEYKVLDSTGSGSDTDIMNAIEAAADAGAQVVSLSLGGTGYSPTLQAAVNYAWQRNTLVVAAAGNDAKNELFFPAGANHAVGVSATDSGNNLAYFSNFGNAVQLAAPGLGILSTAPTYSGTSQGWLNYVSLSGTSMATPFVSGLAGLVAMTTPNATAAAILQRMEQTAASATTGGGWGQNFGFGIIDASSAVSGALRPAANGAIAGQIVNTAGSPLSGGQITINSQTITTDTTGLYRFATLPAGTYPVTVSAPGKPTQSLTATVAPGADTSFTVTMGVTYGKFTGTVADQGLGVPGAIVQALSGGLITAVAIADQAGQYTLWVPGSGTYDVRASQIGRVTTTLTALTLSNGGTTTANLTLPRMGTIAGSVRDGSSNPVANAQVLVTGGTFSAAGTTDAGGNYSLIGVPTGSSYSATATATGFVSSTQNGIAVSADVTTSLNFTMAASGKSAAFVKTDTTTQGSWKGVYGANGYNVIDDTVSYPGYVTVTPAGQSNFIWAGSTSDVRGLRKALSSTDRLAATWYTYGSYTIDLNFNDGAQHRLAVYCLDWDSGGARTQTVSILDGGNNAVLDTQTVSNFQNGKYVVWNLTGHVIVKVTNTGAVNAVVSGLFFDPIIGGSTVAAPTFTPPEGTYGSAQSVTIGTTTSGASIRYTTDGSTPSSTVGTPYSGPVSVSSNLTLKAIAYEAGMPDSAVSSAAYGIQAAMPTFNPPAGSYSSTQSVTISTTTSGASIRYTTDGSTPSSTVGTPYSGPVSVSSSLTLKAIAYMAGMTDSLVASGNYTIQVATPTLNPPAGSYSSTQSVTISTTSGASIRYTTDGSTPSSTVGTPYSGPVSVSSSLTLKAIAYMAGMTDSLVASGNYTIQAATPTFNPPAGSYSSTQSVTISTTSGASIRYTTDGSTPSSTVGTPYSGPVSVSSSLTLKAVAYMAGMADSAVASGSYTISGGGGGNTAAFVKTDTTTQGSWKGVYGANGYNVIDDTVSYPGYVTVTPAGQSNFIWAGSTSDVRGLRKALSSTDRLAATWYTYGSYTIDLNFNDGLQHQLAVYCLDWDWGGARTQTISILDGGNNAVLNTQTVSNFQNGKYVVWNLTGHVVVKVTLAGGINAVISGLFFDPIVSGSTVAAPTFTPPEGTYGSAQSVTIGTTTSGASIRYTTDGSTPSSTVGTPYSGPVSVSSNLTLKAIAYEAGMPDSAVSSAAYGIQVAMPTFNPPAGSYSSTQSVTIGTTTSGASIRYTTDGSTPSSTVGTPYSGPVSVSSSLTLKAIAYEAGMADSAVASAAYTISGGGGGNTAVFVKTDTTTEGNWKGVYGANGYNVIDDTASYPGYVTVTPAGQSNFIWAGSTSDARGLQKALSSTDRLAATWYTYGSYTIDLNFNDGLQHQLAVYCLDWDWGGARTQTISILDGGNNAVLDTQTVSNFQNGKYVVWNLTGHVVLKVTNVGAINAVVSGLFFN